MKDVFQKCTGFEWDEGNSYKNWIKHRVRNTECEQVFFNQPLLIGDDEEHSQTERRWYLLGKTDAGRLLFVIFTIRGALIRIISARDMSKKEGRIYYEL